LFSKHITKKKEKQIAFFVFLTKAECMATFEDLAITYDRTINWSTRLSRELPFLLCAMQNVEDGQILDLACGSGRHALEFAKRGFDVVGLDKSVQMIEAAKQLASDNKIHIDFRIGDMVDVKNVVDGSFDLIICLGNSLALLPTPQAVKQTLQGVFTLLRKGGVFVFQVLNFQEIHQSGFRVFPMKLGQLAQGQKVIFLRFFETIKKAESARLIFAGLIQEKTQWQTNLRSQKVLQLDSGLMTTLLQDTKFRQIDFFGNYERSPFSPSESRNLVAVAMK
jgi:2-polyprenyl-3-methyl-5-hydroxy-6-metoxy-1,4-benzoquinol methylase